VSQHPDGEAVARPVTWRRPRTSGSGTDRTPPSALTEGLRTRGARGITLEVGDGNLGAPAMYRGPGFAVEGRRPGYLLDREDALLPWQHEPGGARDDGPSSGRLRDPATPRPRATS